MSQDTNQATVHTFDDEAFSGEVITDSGRVLPFTREVFARSGLRTLRVGQRLNVESGSDGLSRLWIDGIGAGQRIH